MRTATTTAITIPAIAPPDNAPSSFFVVVGGLAIAVLVTTPDEDGGEARLRETVAADEHGVV